MEITRPVVIDVLERRKRQLEPSSGAPWSATRARVEGRMEEIERR